MAVDYGAFPGSSGSGVSAVVIPISRIVGFTLRRPLHVVVELRDGYAIATAYDLDVIETGEDEMSAVDALREALGELASVLLRPGEKLSSHLDDQRRFLASIVET